MISVGVLAITGYTGIELFQILARHPSVEVMFGSSESNPGERLSHIYPKIKGMSDIELQSLEACLERTPDLVISCLPRTVAMVSLPAFLSRGVRVIDLSGDFRLDSPEAYRNWYRAEHKAPHLLRDMVYGLPEINREAIREATLVGAPGCYPTSVILGLALLAERGLIDMDDIVVDSKSGISGAGRKLSMGTHFVENNENIVPYEVGRSHRHAAEMEQELGRLAGDRCRVVFTPQKVPINQGILSTIYVRLKEQVSEKEVRSLYQERYAEEPFVRIADGYLPETQFVQGTNFCDVGLHRVEGMDRLIVLSAIDNLIKGAVGQIVQAMNLMFGLEETTGLL